jgi:hypothetical protein
MEIKIRVDTDKGEKMMTLSNEYFDNFNFVDMYFDKVNEGENEEQTESSTELLNVYTVPVEELYYAVKLLDEYRKNNMEK